MQIKRSKHVLLIEAARLAEDVVGHPLPGAVKSGGNLRKYRERAAAAARATTGQTAFGAAEVDPAKGTRQFHDGKWYYFDTLECRSRFMAQHSQQK